MDIKLKQRLVGAMVLIALAVIFLPSLFHKDERVVVDTVSLIPSKPSVDPIVITGPIKLDGVKPAPKPDKAFQPALQRPSQSSSQSSPKSSLGQISAGKTDAKKVIKPVIAKAGASESTIKKSVSKVTPKPAAKAATKKTVKKVIPKPSLNKQGIPSAWVVQVASLQSKEGAAELTKKLQNNRYKSYFRSIKTPKGTFFRVFVGPYIDKSRAIRAKGKLDKAYSVDSRVITFAPE